MSHIIHIYTIHGHDLADVSGASRSYGFEHTLTLENMEGRGLPGRLGTSTWRGREMFGSWVTYADGTEA